MIKFPCICGQPFELDDDQAGTEFQCPKCGRLVDVPAINDLHNLKEDGTYIIDVAPLDTGRSIDELHRVFTRARTTETGEEIDLRNNQDDFEIIGATPQAAQIISDKPAAPRYDTFTGELIKPIEVKIEPELRPAPRFLVGQSGRALAYATQSIMPGARPGQMLLGLFHLNNFVVMLFIFVLQIMLLLSATIAVPFAFVFILPSVLGMGLIGHYANVVQEMGPGDHDELPRPFRYASFVEDIWFPFVQTMFACIVCYLPAALSLWLVPVIGSPLALLLAVLGTWLYPAALLTCATSGVLVNMRYDRILFTSFKMQAHYPLIAIAYFFGFIGYVGGSLAIVGSGVAALSGMASLSALNHLVLMPIGFVLLLAGIYFLHWASWYLGIMWRLHHQEFPWVAQRYEKPKVTVMKEPTVAQAIAKRKYEARQAQQRSLRGL